MVDNAVAKHGPDGQLKLLKPRGPGERPKKIDGVIALAQALDPAILEATKSGGAMVRVY
jgi:hypothetical protein